MRPSIPRGCAPGAQRYRDGFVEHVHRLLARGYDLLALEQGTSRLRTKEEPEITGLLKGAMNRARHDPRIRNWAWRYYILEDPPVDDHGLEGKRRPRIDIQVVRLQRTGPEPGFQFEAKRLCNGKSTTEYVGSEGLKSLLDGWYAREHGDAGMLGYVQAGSSEDWAAEVNTRLGRRPGHFGLPDRGEYWKRRSQPADLQWSFTSFHPNAKGRPLRVHHAFLLCY